MCDYCDVTLNDNDVASNSGYDGSGVLSVCAKDKSLFVCIWESCRESMSAEFNVNFCPMCGRQLSEPKPLTLAELRERDGEPVWDDRCKEWGIIDGDVIQHCGNHCDYIIYEGRTMTYFYDRPPTQTER